LTRREVLAVAISSIIDSLVYMNFRKDLGVTLSGKLGQDFV